MLRIAMTAFIPLLWAAPLQPVRAQEDATRRDGILLHVLPSQAGEVRYQSTIRENEFAFLGLGPERVTVKEVQAQARTQKIYIREVSSDTFAYTRQMTRFTMSRTFVDNDGSKHRGCETTRDFKSSSGGCERGDGVDRLDTDRPADRADLEKDPMRYLLATREDVVERSDGSTLRYDATGRSSEVNASWKAIIEREMENGVVMFPDHPVRVNDTWSMGRLEFSDAKSGIVERDIEGRLDRMVTGGLPGLAPDERAVVVAVTGRNFRHRFDRDSAAASYLADKARLMKHEETGEIVFSLDRREIVTDVRKLVLEFEVETIRPGGVAVFSLSQAIKKGRGTIEGVARR